MSRRLFIFLPIAFIVVSFFLIKIVLSTDNALTGGAPPYGELEEDIPRPGRLSWLENWQRPEGPAKVTLQVGHWKKDDLPEELEKLKVSGGSSGGGKDEWEVNLARKVLLMD